MIIAKNLFGWTLGEARERFNALIKERCLVDQSMFVTKIGDDDFVLSSGDRDIFITGEFLDRCASDHAENIRNAMMSINLGLAEPGE